MSAIAGRLREIADELDAAEKRAAAQLKAAEDAAEEAEGNVEEYREEAARAERHAASESDRADDALSDIEKILEAAIAAREGIPGAAAGTVRVILDLQPDLVADVGRLTLLARIRPADYWSH